MEILKNYIHGKWWESLEGDTINVVNPANQEVMAKVPFGEKTALDVDAAVHSASEAFKAWRDLPVMKRVQPLYKLKQLLEENIDEFGTADHAGMWEKFC